MALTKQAKVIEYATDVLYRIWLLGKLKLLLVSLMFAWSDFVRVFNFVCFVILNNQKKYKLCNRNKFLTLRDTPNMIV